MKLSHITAMAALLIATPALAQTAPDVVLIPRGVAEAAMEQIRHPSIMNNIDTYAALQACVADNPHAGMNMRSGQDQCPAVTQAIAARDKELADAKAPKATPDAAKLPTPEGK